MTFSYTSVKCLKVFVISDTHDRLSTIRKFLSILEPGEGFLVHLGDVVSPFTLRTLVDGLPAGYKLEVVLGNNDGDVLLLSKVAREVVDQPDELELCDLRVLAFHGFKTAEFTERVAESLACGGYYDIIMYGHTHRPRLDRKCRSYMLNPGALSGYLSELSTYAVLDCRESAAYIVSLEDGRILKSVKLSRGTDKTPHSLTSLSY